MSYDPKGDQIYAEGGEPLTVSARSDELGYDELGVKALLDALGIPAGDDLALSDRVGILAARYERCLANG